MAIFKLELVQLDLSGEQTNGRVGEKETLRPKIQPHFVRQSQTQCKSSNRTEL